MRIIAGEYRHRLIEYPDDAAHIRPTKDRIREAVFGALGDISNKNVLDLYAGSGAMGLEALSRGARHVTFVDQSTIAIKTVKNNVASLKIEPQKISILFNTDKEAIKQFKEEKCVFDIVILDPPYKEGNYQEIVNELIDSSLISKYGILILECDKILNIETNEVFSKEKDYKYGEIVVKIMRR